MSDIKILIVDDEKDLLDLLAEDIESLGFYTVKANNGLEAFEILKKNKADKHSPFDTILSDINMPKMDGLTLLGNVRNEIGSVPFIFLSGYADKEKAIQALRLGAIDLLDKPYNRNQLLDTIKKAANLGKELRHLEDEVQEALIKASVKIEEQEKYTKLQKEILLIKKIRETYFK